MASYGTGTNFNIINYAKEKNAKIVDLRSDTLTVPTESMRLAMYKAEVGDDVYGEDPTVTRLQKKAAQLLGKEDAIFVSSGTMGNLIAIMIHCDVRGSEAYCGTESHIQILEQGGAAQIAGVTLRPIPNESDGTFNLEQLERCIRNDHLYEPVSKLVLVENTINGKVVPLKWISELSTIAQKHNLRTHLDGARFWNAVSASEIAATKLASHFDSVTFCLSKGLGAPAGSLLCGTKSFIEKAKRVRKVLGGGMRQIGGLAAAGLVALEEILPILKKDHDRTITLAREINNIGMQSGFHVDIENVHTNMIFVQIKEQVVKDKEFLRKLEEINDDDVEEDRFIVRGLALGNNHVRFVFHHQISDELLQGAIRKVKKVINSYK